MFYVAEALVGHIYQIIECVDNPLALYTSADIAAKIGAVYICIMALNDNYRNGLFCRA